MEEGPPRSGAVGKDRGTLRMTVHAAPARTRLNIRRALREQDSKLAALSYLVRTLPRKPRTSSFHGASIAGPSRRHELRREKRIEQV